MADVLGVFGAICVVLAYVLLQTEKISARTYTYNLINLSGAVLLLISLFINFNLGSFVIEIVWVSVSVYGLYQTYRKNNASKDEERYKDSKRK